MANKMTLAEKEAALKGLELLLILYTIKCTKLQSGMCLSISFNCTNNYVARMTQKYILLNKSFIEWFNCRFIYEGHYYKLYDTIKRIKYLKKHIKKLKKELGYKI